MPSFTDQTGRTITLDQPPRRIISLVPSQTEMLADLGLAEEVVGLTKFCVHPREWFNSKPRVGGTKQVRLDQVHALKPDLVIANKEENVKEQVEELEKHYPVWVSDVNNLADAYEMIGQIGSMTGKTAEAAKIIDSIKANFAQLSAPDLKPSAAYLIWRNPYMTIGGDTFIHAMLETAGFRNVFKQSLRYPEITIEQLKQANPGVLLLSSEPFPFKEKHREELQELLPSVKILLVDGELFSWYGSRLRLAPAYFEKLQAVCYGQ